MKWRIMDVTEMQVRKSNRDANLNFYFCKILSLVYLARIFGKYSKIRPFGAENCKLNVMCLAARVLDGKGKPILAVI